jgi:FG-GAP-like repeat
MPTGTLSFTANAFTIPPGAPGQTMGTASSSFNIPLSFMGIVTLARVVDLQINLGGLTHTFPDDLDFLLVGPDGRSFEFWSDAGSSIDINNCNFTITDSAVSALPDQTAITSGTYRPADYEVVEGSSNWGLSPGLIVNHPSTATLNSVFGGELVTGTWTLYLTDDAFGDVGSLADWGVQITYNIIVKPNDFDPNSRSDILWQQRDGTPGIWLMNGFNATSVGPAGPNAPWPFNPGPNWRVKDGGDFNDDGRADILWQNIDGTPAIWLMNGLTAVAMGNPGTNPGPNWQIKGAGDFNFDNKADILWQNSDGTPGIWLMSGLSVVASGIPGSNPGPSWQIKGIGDFNNDGRADILWQNSDGTPGIWFMNGLSLVASGVAGAFNPGPDWHIIA